MKWIQRRCHRPPCCCMEILPTVNQRVNGCKQKSPVLNLSLFLEIIIFRYKNLYRLLKLSLIFYLTLYYKTMAKFVFVVPPLTGHVNPTLSIGAELLERGHEVAWISLDKNLTDKLPTGGKLLLIQYDQSDEEKKESEQYLDIISKKIVYGIDSIKFLYEDVLIPLNTHCYKGI